MEEQQQQQQQSESEKENRLEKLENEKEAEVEVVSQITRRKAVIIVVVLVIVLAIIFIVAAAIITVQIQNVYSTGPSPPVSSYINNTTSVGKDTTGIPQGGMLISRPNFMYSAIFTTDLFLTVSGTTTGTIVWQANILGLAANSGAILQLTDHGILLVWIPDGTEDGKTIVVSDNSPSEIPGAFYLQVTEFQTPNATNPFGGQIQILSSDGTIVWWRGIPYPDTQTPSIST